MFLKRTTDKHKDYNYCYDFDEDGDLLLKDECSDCEFCKIDDIYCEGVCSAKQLCEHG